MTRPAASRLAVQEAELAGVDLATVRGTGPGGRVELRDVVKAAAPARQAAAAKRLAASAHRPLRAVPSPAAATKPARAAQPAASAPPRAVKDPTVPVFTASGAPPETVLRVPPSVRRAVAAATTQAEVWRLVREYEGYGEVADAQAAARLRCDQAVSVDDGGAGMPAEIRWPSYPGWPR